MIERSIKIVLLAAVLGLQGLAAQLIDTDFAPLVDSSVFVVATQTDGKAVVGGEFTGAAAS